MAVNVEMNYYDGNAYEALYPKISDGNILGVVKVSQVGAGGVANKRIYYNRLPSKPVLIQVGTLSGYGGTNYQYGIDGTSDRGNYPLLDNFSRCAYFVLNDGEYYTIVDLGKALVQSESGNGFVYKHYINLSLTVKAYTTYTILTTTTTGSMGSEYVEPTDSQKTDILFENTNYTYEWYFYYLI